jgi:hypothetical protein
MTLLLLPIPSRVSPMQQACHQSLVSNSRHTVSIPQPLLFFFEVNQPLLTVLALSFEHRLPALLHGGHALQQQQRPPCYTHYSTCKFPALYAVTTKDPHKYFLADPRISPMQQT